MPKKKKNVKNDIITLPKPCVPKWYKDLETFENERTNAIQLIKSINKKA